MMPFIGVRISWLMLARNSLLARLASIALSRAMVRSAFTAESSAVRASTVRSSPSLCCTELDIAAMDLRKHLVEAVDEVRDFVLALTLTLDANIVGPVPGHGACHGGETQQWRRDRALHARRQNDGDAERRDEDESDDEPRGGRLRPEHREVGFDHDRADYFAVEHDGTGEQQFSVGKLAPLVMRLDIERSGGEPAIDSRPRHAFESRELIAVLGPDRGRDDAFVDGQTRPEYRSRLLRRRTRRPRCYWIR